MFCFVSPSHSSERAQLWAEDPHHDDPFSSAQPAGDGFSFSKGGRRSSSFSFSFLLFGLKWPLLRTRYIVSKNGRSRGRPPSSHPSSFPSHTLSRLTQRVPIFFDSSQKDITSCPIFTKGWRIVSLRGAAITRSNFSSDVSFLR